MTQVDRTDDFRVVRELDEASRAYQRQFVLWLGIGSGGGMAALLSFSANLPDPDFALKALLPSLSAFATVVVFAAATVLFRGLRDSVGAFHHGEAHNREESGRAIPATPQVFSYPKTTAEEMNRGRDDLIEQIGLHTNERRLLGRPGGVGTFPIAFVQSYLLLGFCWACLGQLHILASAVNSRSILRPRRSRQCHFAKRFLGRNGDSEVKHPVS